MDDCEETPLFFANKVIHKFVDNLTGMSITNSQVDSIRVVFRQVGGEWTHIVAGDPTHVGLLIRVVQAWGRMNQKKEKANA